MLNHNAAYEAVAAGYPNCISSMFIAECNIWSRNICWIIDPRDFTIGFYSVTIDPVLAKTKTAMCPHGQRYYGGYVYFVVSLLGLRLCSGSPGVVTGPLQSVPRS